ncbi:hypothetical protein BY458DRAFT_445571 [Sporodiniella umbellata]|nr:hypothetical protein BY458DRAFT_445571 [Sporodiniella umbellata]
MTSLTETIEQLLAKKVSFPNLLNKREIWNINDAERIMKSAINNVKNKKNVNLQHVEDFEEEWQNFLNSSAAEVYFEIQKNKHNIILESLSEKNYNSRVRRDFFDKEEQATKRPCISLNVNRFYHQ